jgi:hypothetical protein
MIRPAPSNATEWARSRTKRPRSVLDVPDSSEIQNQVLLPDSLLVGTLGESRDPNTDGNRKMLADKRLGPGLSDSRGVASW